MIWRTRYLVAPALVGLALALSCGRADAQRTLRRLAPGVLTVIPPEPKEEETFQGPLSLPFFTRSQWTPVFSPESETLGQKASSVVLRHNIWNLEFAFKPLRMIYVDIPQTNGKMRRKLIWYMVYRVKNTGQHLTPVAMQDQFGHTTYRAAKVDKVLNLGAAEPSGTVRFYPHFVLESREQGKAYLDRVIPVAIPPIQTREMRGANLFNSVEITRIDIPVSTPTLERSVWGVVTWEDVDPRIDYFSIYVQGLTNAFRVETAANGGVVHRLKTLQLNFWRPGDVVYEHEGEIRYGVPAVSDPAEQAKILAHYGLQKRVDHLWVYR